MPLPTIIVPVFNALEHVEKCLHSIARTVPPETPVIIIDDASTQAGVLQFLQFWAKQVPACRSVIVHGENRGFVASANQGMRLASGDVVLLNSDTEVTNGWLQRLADCLDSGESTATATPWSNNGEIVSIPEFCVPNPAPGNADEIASTIAACGKPVYPDLPTAVGFCMAVSATAIEQIGLFDEDTFGRGYGEENDFCQRAEKTGMRNVLCDDAYVVHHGGASFQPLGLKPDENSMQRLLAKHPDYLQKVIRFIREDPLAPRRCEILACLERSAVVMR